MVDRTGRQDGTAVIFDMDHTEATYAAAELLRARFARVVLITPRDTIAVDVQMVTRQGILRRLAEQRIEVVTLCDAALERWRSRTACWTYTNVYTGEVGVHPRRGVPGVRDAACAERCHGGRSAAAGVPVRLVGDCLAPLELLAATATGHAAGEAV